MKIAFVTRATLLFFLFNTASAVAAINPIDIQLAPTNGLPEITQIGEDYTISYTFINNLPFPQLIKVTAVSSGSNFILDNLCNQVVLAPSGRENSSCTANIEFQPIASGPASIKLSLAYDKNVITRSLSTNVANSCGVSVYPSNTGVAVPPPIINSTQVWQFVSAPELHPMKVTVSPYSAGLASGLIFNGPYASSQQATYGQSGALITDNDGNPIWFRALGSTSLMNTDVRVQTLDGQPVLTFWQGTLATSPTYTNLPGGAAEPGACYYILDKQYHVIKTVSAFYGFTPDVHEFLITPNNTALFLATDVVPMDLTPYGGPANGLIHNYQ